MMNRIVAIAFGTALLGLTLAQAKPSSAGPDKRTFDEVVAVLRVKESKYGETFKALRHLEILNDPRTVPELEKILQDSPKMKASMIRGTLLKVKFKQLKTDEEKIAFLRLSAQGKGTIAQWALEEAFEQQRRNKDFRAVLSEVAGQRENKNWGYAAAMLEDAKRYEGK